MHHLIKIGVLIFICGIFAGCVTDVDPSLPKPQLQAITLAAQVNLAASSSHPSNFLPVNPIPAGAKVDMIASDSSLAWLLVEHENKLGWVPAFFSQMGTGRVEPPIVIKPLDGSCTQYIGATFEADESWVSNTLGSIIVEGSIFRPNVGNSFSRASLIANITGPGKIVSSDYLHLPLTPSSNIIFFAFAIEKVTQKSAVQFVLDDMGTEELSFQATFFVDNCGEDRSASGKTDASSLSIGQVKMTLPTPPPVKPTKASTATPTDKSIGTSDATPEPASPSTPLRIEVNSGSITNEEIQTLVDLWDEIHHEVDRTLNPSRLPEVLTGGALRQQEQTLKNLKAGSCYWEFTDLSPSRITKVQEISANEVLVTMDKHGDVGA